jgi:hypothetical protein
MVIYQDQDPVPDVRIRIRLKSSGSGSATLVLGCYSDWKCFQSLSKNEITPISIYRMKYQHVERTT